MQNGQAPQQQGQRRQTQDSALEDYNHNAAAHDDFLDQMLSSLPWIDLNPAKSPWELAAAANGAGDAAAPNGTAGTTDALHYAAAPYDESTLLASRLRQHQISEGINQVPQHQRHLLVSGMGRTATGGDAGILPLPLSLGGGGGDPADSGLLQVGDAFYSRFGGSLQRAAPAAAAMQQNFQHAQAGAAASSNPGGAGQAAATAGGGAAPPRQRVRARRGQATDPHSIAERMRRERIAERMKALQELVPNANKTDKASMLDDIIDYVKFLQLQVKVLSMSRLGGAAAVVPLVANMSSEGRGGAAYQAEAGADGLTVTEHQVAKMMEEDVGSAMQYLQGKGLCLMPISLASAISATHPRGAAIPNGGGGNLPVPAETPSSPSMSVLTVQSAMANGGDAAGKDAASVSKP